MIFCKDSAIKSFQRRYGATPKDVQDVTGQQFNHFQNTGNTNYRYTPDRLTFTTSIIGIQPPDPVFIGRIAFNWHWYSTPTVGTSIRSVFYVNVLTGISAGVYSYDTMEILDYRNPFTTIGSAYPTMVYNDSDYWPKYTYQGYFTFLFMQFGFYTVGGVMPLEYQLFFEGYAFYFS